MFIAETLLCFTLVRAIPLRTAEDSEVFFDSTGSECVLEVEDMGEAKFEVQTLTPASSLEEAIAKDLGSVPQVAYVLTENLPDALLVWVAVDEPDEATRYKIYDKELGLIVQFPEVDFDFNLVSTLGRTAHELANGAQVSYSRS